MRPWTVGFVPVDGGGSGKGASLRHESTSLTIDDKDDFDVSVDGDVDFDVTGVQYSFAIGANLLRLQLAAVTCDNVVPGVDSDAGVLGGVAFALPIRDVGRFVWGGELGFQGGAIGWTQPAYGDTTIGWFQYDLRTGLAYAPTAASVAAVSPRFGLGLRVIDGVQDLGSGGTTDFDAVAPYALAGIGAHVRADAKSRFVFDLHALVGGVQGVELAIGFQF